MSQASLRILLAVVLCAGSSLVAQTGTPATGTTPSAQQPTAPTTARPGDLVLTGCLRGSAAAIGTSPGQGMIYTLEVTEPALPKPSATTTSGDAARTAMATTTTYTLSAPEVIGLAKHVDHEVQLTGIMQPPASAARTPGAAGSSTPAPAGKPGGAHRTVQVSSLKMMSAKCPK